MARHGMGGLSYLQLEREPVETERPIAVLDREAERLGLPLVRSTKISNASLGHLLKFRELRHLDVGDNALDNEGLQHVLELGNSSNCRWIKPAVLTRSLDGVKQFRPCKPRCTVDNDVEGAEDE